MPLTASYITNRGINVRGRAKAMSALWSQTWTNPAAGSDTAYVTTLTPLAAAGTKTAYSTYPGYTASDVVFDGTLATGVPDFPRNVSIVVTHASAVVALSGTITGKDEYGNQLTEDWSVTAGTTSKTFTGKKSFAVVQTVTVVSATDASGDTVTIGTGNVFGVSVNVSVASAVKEVAAGSVVTTGTFVATSTASTDDPRGTYAPNTTPDGANDYTIWIISDNPEASA